MIKPLVALILSLSLANASDGYVRLSDLDNKTLKENSFVSLDSLEENSGWVSLTSLEDSSFESINLDDIETNVVVNLDKVVDDYIALDLYDTDVTFENTQDEYVSLDEMDTFQEYDIVAVYEEMLKDEEQTILSMNISY